MLEDHRQCPPGHGRTGTKVKSLLAFEIIKIETTHQITPHYFWYYYGIINLLLIVVACLANYQSKVMYIKRKNAIIRYHFRNDKTFLKEYQYIDSLIHHYGVYDAYDIIRNQQP